ncbi:hypothetical protein E4U60_002198 [Claviceps pazoutovae]|uniref:Uncharacterized protein n=1 Tax=Claviceps pazoutovae TaxID=1649127 RepID=A0A9P7MJL9_9HYPO|nr:hypothetical protein E4U60_002198 [Claviceps pazoutovae]
MTKPRKLGRDFARRGTLVNQARPSAHSLLSIPADVDTSLNTKKSVDPDVDYEQFTEDVGRYKN